MEFACLNIYILKCILNPVLHRWIREYKGLYSVNNLGTVYSHRWNKIKKLSPSRLGDKYLKVSLMKNNSLFQESLHRLVASTFLGIEKGEYVDHINFDKTDNRISNLRVCTPSQSAHHKKNRKRKSGLPRGVYQDKVNKYYAVIVVNKKQIYLGSYDTIDLADESYKKASREYFHEFSIA